MAMPPAGNSVNWRTLVGPGELEAALDDRDVRVVDCRFDLSDSEYGRQAWRESRIPGAAHADLEHDLSGAVSERTGRHPLPAVEDFIAWLAGNGLGRETRVACYDDGPGAFAARLWWLLRHWLGHERVAVLDGGLAAWKARGLPVEAGAPSPAPAAHYPPRPPADVTADADALANRDAGTLVDARAAARFRGEEEPVDPVAGHVPSALNRPFMDNLDVHGRWHGPAELRAQWHAVLGGHAGAGVVHMCGSGVTACHNVLSMEHAGLPAGRLYPGSWSEWIRDPARPVARGPERSGERSSGES